MDPITATLCDKLQQRAAKGLKEYKVSLADADLSRAQVLEHLQEELLDAAAYIEKLLGMEDA